MSLRTRLVLTTVGLVAIALGLVAGATFGALQDWHGPGNSKLMALTTPEALLAASEELTSRIALVLAGTSAFALVCLTVLAAHLARRGLRPLDRIVEAAAHIGSGDLDRRIESAPPGTEVGRLAHALNAMLVQLERAFRQREASEERLRRFIADASHELRTPIATIRGYAELFRRGAHDRPEDLARAMHRIEAESARMGLLVEEMLLLARLDQGRPLEREPVSLVSLAADAVADTRAVDPSRSITLEYGTPVVVTGDPARLRQVVANLLTNVLHHTPEGTAANVRVAEEDGFAVLEVSDEGPGLTSEQAERVFERFYRGDHRQPEAQRGGGAGLGLSIVASVVAAHGGLATASSAQDKGTTFTVRIPLARA
ncbi:MULTISPECIES: sensor histidine kinase [Nonomuraea]|uniref:histidine kinase n=2 Tax=Nonomuraea TaxID=83681 RepID=A0A7W5V1W2_9ACTN|nr:HAMP domain-containing sensor histidine kinase [Nonomuraea dietziae]MBB3728877.1 two-component system OmpR family sensor kinase [Nonomuraea dietziae]